MENTFIKEPTPTQANASFQIDLQRANKFIGRIKNPILFRLFLITKLPLAFVAGVRISDFSTHTASVNLKYRWINQNPFRSTYFAALAMAAEMPTGLLGMLAIDNSRKSIAILVTNIEAGFVKKAADITTFTCEDGPKFFDAVAETCATGKPVQVRSLSVGRNKAGEEVARFYVTWSLKKRSKQ